MAVRHAGFDRKWILTIPRPASSDPYYSSLQNINKIGHFRHCEAEWLIVEQFPSPVSTSPNDAQFIWEEWIELCQSWSGHGTISAPKFILEFIQVSPVRNLVGTKCDRDRKYRLKTLNFALFHLCNVRKWVFMLNLGTTSDRPIYSTCASLVSCKLRSSVQKLINYNNKRR